MNQDSSKGKDLVSIIISFVVMVVTLITFFFSSVAVSPIAYIIFGIIVIVLLVYFSTFYVTEQWKNLINSVGELKLEVDEIKKSLKYENFYFDMDKRVSILESFIKRKKGSIDPRIIFWIILVILLLLFLKSIGFFG